jgi:hypothetical protein
VLYVDFKSMYPTVNALMGLWRFVIADGLTWRDATAEVRAFLSAVTVEHLREPAAWPWLTAIVRVRPDGDLLPTRAKYDGRVHTIGLNHLTCGEGLWCTLADVVAAKVLTGKAPAIEEAIVFEPGPPQEGLRPIDLFGRPEFRVDPSEDDVFTRLIDLRDDAKARGDDVQKAIKIVANATSYGIFVEVNLDPETGELRPLYAFAISAKRYVLFNLDDDGRPVIRKASAHGLGHLRPPYEAKDAPADIPPPSVPLSKIGVERWQYDLWFKIIEAALSDTPHKVALDYHPALARPAVSRYGATSPALLRWFKGWNAGRSYHDQVKPFGFMLAFMGRNRLWARARAELLDALPGPGRPKQARPELHPGAPFDRDHETAMANAFDRETGEPVPAVDLMTYAEALAGYHLSAESKFGNAEAFHSGRTERRRVIAACVRLIGKEANRLENDMPANVLGDDVTAFKAGSAEQPHHSPGRKAASRGS